MKVLITGAHFTPAQAVIEQLQKIDNIEIVYIGRKYTLEGDSTPSVESQVLPKLGIKFIPITAGRIRRIIEFKSLISLLKIPVGFIQAFYFLLKEKPDVLLSFGGYIGVSVVIPAWILNVPIIVHEQTLISGLANKISNIFATKIAVSFDKKFNFNPQKLILTGNPVRQELITKTGDKNHLKNIRKTSRLNHIVNLAIKDKLPIIYISGGNQGSHVINQAVGEVLDKLTEKAYIIHQTGDSKYKDFENLFKIKNSLTHKDRYFIQKWFDVQDVGLIYNKTDLAVSRAGVNTLSELALFGIPTIVVPLPYLYQDEQNINAQFFTKIGLAHSIKQDIFSGKMLLEKTNELLSDLNVYKKQALSAKNFIILDAAKKITQEVLIQTKYG